MPPDRLAQLLLCVIGPIALYAAFRGLVGPTDNEREFVEMRTNNVVVGDTPKNSGSFTSSFGLASLLVPASVFALILAYLTPRHRLVGVAVFLLSAVGLLASYIRTALVAVVAGALVLAALIVKGARVPALRRRHAAALVVLVLVGGYGATVVAGTADERAQERAVGLLNPLQDESVQTRFDTWEASLAKVVREPLGTGLGTVGRATVTSDRGDDSDGDLSGTYTDSSYLLILQEQGFLGGALFLFGIVGLPLLCARRFAAKDPVERPLGVAALVAFISFLVLFLMADYIEQPGKVLSWTLLGIASWEAYRP
jgi:O-antigen ligase